MPAARLTPRGGRRGRTPIKAIFDSDDSSDEEGSRPPPRPPSSGSDDSSTSPTRGRPIPNEKSPPRKAASPKQASTTPSPPPRPPSSGSKSRLGDRSRASPSPSERANAPPRVSGTPPKPVRRAASPVQLSRATPPSVRRALAANLDDSETDLDQSMVSNASASTSTSTLFWQTESRGKDGPAPTLSQSPLTSPFKPPEAGSSGDVVEVMQSLYKTQATAMMGSAYQELRVGAGAAGGAAGGTGGMDDLLNNVDRTLSQARDRSGSVVSGVSSLASSRNATPQRSPTATGAARRGRSPAQRVRIDTAAPDGPAPPLPPASPGLQRRLEKMEQRILAQPSPGAVSSKLYSTEMRTAAQVKEVHSRLQDLETEVHQLKATAVPQAASTRGAAVRAASIEADVRELHDRLARADAENDELRERLEAAEASLEAAGGLAERLAAFEASAHERAAGDRGALASEVSHATATARHAADRVARLEEDLRAVDGLRAAVRSLEERYRAEGGPAGLEQRCLGALEEALGGEAEGLAARVERLEVRARKGDQGRQELHDELVDVISSVQSLESRSPLPGQARTVAALQAEVAAALGGMEERVSAAEALVARAGRLAPASPGEGGGGDGAGGGGGGGVDAEAMEVVAERLRGLEVAYRRMAQDVEGGKGGGIDPKLEGRVGEMEEHVRAIMGLLGGEEGAQEHEGEAEAAPSSRWARGAWCVALLMLLCGVAALGGMLWLMWEHPDLTVEDEVERARECVSDLAHQYLPAMGLMETGRSPT